jgi:hydroxymethylpyrimidine/phosphomethylpyrimidine kinase
MIPSNPAGPAVVVVGGIDPSGGAGLLRDVATAAARGARAHAIGTAWTEQGEGVHRVEARDPAAIRVALARAVVELKPAAIKVGMAVGPATATALIEGLRDYAGPVVVDPVLATSRGGSLWEGEPDALVPLLRRATLVTPNAGEVGELAGHQVETGAGAESAARFLIDRHRLGAVLVKGGHIDQAEAVVTDVLVTADGARRWSRPRVPGATPRGTGCALATAIAVELGRGRALADAVEAAAAWLAGAIASAVDAGSERHLPPG